MVNKPLIRPAISGGGTWPGGGRLTSHDIVVVGNLCQFLGTRGDSSCPHSWASSKCTLCCSDGSMSWRCVSWQPWGKFLYKKSMLGVEPKIGVVKPPNPFVHRVFHEIFTIHFGGKIPLFLETPMSVSCNKFGFSPFPVANEG